MDHSTPSTPHPSTVRRVQSQLPQEKNTLPFEYDRETIN